MKLVTLLATYRRTPAEAASYWVVLRDRRSLTAGEEAAFAAWNADPTHAEAYRRASRAMGLFDAFEDDPGLRALRQAALETTAAPRRRHAVAAGAALAAGLAAAILFLPDNGLRFLGEPIEAPGPSWTAYATGVGEKRVVQLPDGSSVTLDTDSQLAVAMTGEQRMVQVRHGRVLFEVAHDGKRPFTVEAEDRRVTALGTVFGVRSDPGRVDVVLVQGSVVVDRTTNGAEAPGAAQQTPVMLKPGQKFSVEMGSSAKVSAVDVQRELLWRDGLVEFDNETLAQAVAEINRYNNRPILLGDDGAAALHVSGLYRTDADQFIKAIRSILPVSAKPDEQGGIKLTLAPRGRR